MKKFSDWEPESPVLNKVDLFGPKQEFDLIELSIFKQFLNLYFKNLNSTNTWLWIISELTFLNCFSEILLKNLIIETLFFNSFIFLNYM